MLKNAKKLEAALAKDNIISGAANPTAWISTGNMKLNKVHCNRYSVGIPNKKSFLYWGPQGSGKSYLLQKAAVEAQKAGYYVFYLDTEHSIDEDYFYQIGLRGFEDFSMMRPMQVTTLEQTLKTVRDIFDSLDPEDKVFLAIDSLSNLILEKHINDFEKGDVKGDQGQFSKQLKHFTKLMNNYIQRYDMFFGCTGHAYPNQDVTNGKGSHIFSGGESVEFNFSLATFVNKYALKDKTTGKSLGVRVKARCTKTRFNKFGVTADLNLPYDGGLTEWEGLVDDLVEEGLLNKKGSWFSYTDSNGKEVKFQGEKSLGDHYKEILRDVLENEDIPQPESIK